jgi:hypothetical protein
MLDFSMGVGLYASKHSPMRPPSPLEGRLGGRGDGQIKIVFENRGHPEAQDFGRRIVVAPTYIYGDFFSIFEIVVNRQATEPVSN